ncbi:MAG: poly-gamma-glutamate system protein [Synergistaceae bacterium]|nr:poly-gamma-glutamate system protein [Synergistaceae bacterium]
MTNYTRIIILSLLLLAIYFLFHSAMNSTETRLYRKIISAQQFLWDSVGFDTEHDPYHSGFIGVEFSEVTTTMGSLPAKQCSTNPLWAVQFTRWFGELGLTRGDKVLVSASSSFPAMVYSCLAACEEMGLEVTFMLSLGASSWGANRPGLNFADMLSILRKGGFVKTTPSLVTLGGTNENAGGMDDEAKKILQGNVSDAEMVKGLTLDELVALKSESIAGCRLVVNIGGNASSMGTDSMSLNLPAGIVRPSDGFDGGNGLAGNALRAGVPVLHVLNLKGLAEKCGIDFEHRRGDFSRGRSIFGGILSLVVFAAFMITHKRWGYE